MLTASDLSLYLREHRMLAISVGIILFFIILFLISHHFGKEETSTGPRYTPPGKADWVLGDTTTAKGVVVMYSDYECSSCDIYHALLTQLEIDLKGDLALVYRHFPLSATHPNARLAAQAAEAAGAQGKFFEMGEMLFREQRSWKESGEARERFISYAENMGLSKDKFIGDMDSEKTVGKVTDAEVAAREAGMKTAPVVFFNGEYLPIPKTPAELKATIMTKLYGGK